MANPLLFRCNECKLIYQESDLLTAPSPFSEDITITACPNCKTHDDFTNVCDEPGCTEPAGCGWPSDTGYRRTCGKHMRRSK